MAVYISSVGNDARVAGKGSTKAVYRDKEIFFLVSVLHCRTVSYHHWGPRTANECETGRNDHTPFCIA